jgi:hypothetical protein
LQAVRVISLAAAVCAACLDTDGVRRVVLAGKAGDAAVSPKPYNPPLITLGSEMPATHIHAV